MVVLRSRKYASDDSVGCLSSSLCALTRSGGNEIGFPSFEAIAGNEREGDGVGRRCGLMTMDDDDGDDEDDAVANE